METSTETTDNAHPARVDGVVSRDAGSRLYVIVHETGKIPTTKRVLADAVEHWIELIKRLRELHPTAILIPVELPQQGGLWCGSEKELLMLEKCG